MLAANLQADSIFVSDSSGAPLSDFVVGEQINLTARWTSTDLVANTSASMQLLIDGQLFESFSRLMSPGANRSYQQTTMTWFARPGEHTLEFRVDTGNVIAEADETDNIATFAFTPPDPNLPSKFVSPIYGEQADEWFISNYVDMDPRQGQVVDFRGGPFVY